MPPPSRCLDNSELIAFSRGDVGDSAFTTICAHLRECVRCEALLTQLDDGHDGVVVNLRRFMDRPGWHEPSVVAVLEARANAINADTAQGSTASFGHAAPVARQSTIPERLGKYRLEEELGRGGMGVVYKAVHERLRQTVAVKVLLPKLLGDAGLITRFDREVRALGALIHPNIVRATDSDEAEGLHFLVMEFLEGLNVATLVEIYGPLPVPEACELIRQAALGLQCIHENGRVHRDVKPSNLMLTSDGIVKILDLGLALLQEPDEFSEEITRSHHVMGTADYMAPEQWESSHDVDIRADIYSLGCTLYKVLIGQAPFAGLAYRSPVQKQLGHREDAAPPIDELRSDVPQGVTAVLERMLRKDRAERFASPGEVVRLLEPWCLGADLSTLLRETRAKAEEAGPHPPPRLSTDGGRRRAPPAIESATRPASSPGSRGRGRRVTILGLVLLALVGAVGAALIINRPSSETGGSQASGRQRLTTFKIREWHNVLQAPPLEYYFWNPMKKSSWLYDEKSETLSVTSFHKNLLSLGETTAPGYKLTIGFQQTRWSGGFGIFFGGQTEAGNDAQLRYQVVLIEPHGNGQSLRLARHRGGVLLRPPEAPLTSGTGLTSELLRRPLGNEETFLEIVVTPNDGLHSVRWHGEEFVSLVDQSINAGFKTTDYHGHFGICCANSSVTVFSARFMPTE